MSPIPKERTSLASGVWNLVLPQAEHFVCHASVPPPHLAQLARLGARVDVVSRCDFEAWPAGDVPDGLRCLWEPDPEVSYDAALLWDPQSGEDVRAWLANVRALPASPREIALWSRNPLHSSGAPHWWRIDGWIEHRGWRLGQAHLGLPETHRVRQLVEWHAYPQTHLLGEERTEQRWKSWVEKQGPWRWTLPARLRRASLPSVTPAISWLEAIVNDVARSRAAAPHVERIMVSPNGIAIVVLQLLGADGCEMAVLRIPLVPSSEARVAHNASGLDWLEARATTFAQWAHTWPALRARGATNGWGWTLEEHTPGTDAQSWPDGAKRHAMQVLAGFLEKLAATGEPPRPLDDAMFEAFCGESLRAMASLLPRAWAARLANVRTQLRDALRDVPVPLVLRHGDFKLENVLGLPDDESTWRILDWELWKPRGLPLLDAWHLVAARRAREADCAMGTVVRRWLIPGELDPFEKRLIARCAQGLDKRYVEISPILYWLDRIGPIAARGAWPSAGWETANIAPVLEAYAAVRPVEVEA